MKVTDFIYRKPLHDACEHLARSHYEEACALETENPVKFSSGFLKRMKKLIEKVEAHYRSLHYEKRRFFFAYGITKVAVAIFLTVTLAFTVSMSVDAARTNILDFLVEFFDDHIRITSENMDPDGTNAPVGTKIQSEDLLDEYVSSLAELGYSEVRSLELKGGTKQVILQKDSEVILSSRIFDEYVLGTMDYDGGEKTITIDGIEIFCVKESKMWYWTVDNYIYHLITDLDSKEATEILEYLICKQNVSSE